MIYVCQWGGDRRWWHGSGELPPRHCRQAVELKGKTQKKGLNPKTRLWK